MQEGVGNSNDLKYYLALEKEATHHQYVVYSKVDAEFARLYNVDATDLRGD